MIDHRSVALALAILGGAGSLGFVAAGDPFSINSARKSLDEAQRVGLFNLTEGPTTATFATAPVVPQQAAPKVDRLAMATKLAVASVGTLPTDVGLLRPVAYSVVTRTGDENETLVVPELAFAALGMAEPTDGTLDQLSGKVQPTAIPSMPTETPEIAEEEDDATPTTLAVPVPRAKPVLDPTLPMPKLKPTIEPGIAMALPSRLPQAKPAVPQPIANPGAIPIKPPVHANPILAMFSTPNTASLPDAPSPVSRPPQGTIVTPTPFGVPYVLQTQTVDTACLKPELLELMRHIEAHYGRKVVVTSGYRNRGRAGSLHRTCSAADIVVPGVDSHALSAFARTLPGIGGVGTYCHGSMIHVDIGTPRDWKYGCGSYFAMRDGTAHWGKVPQED